MDDATQLRLPSPTDSGGVDVAWVDHGRAAVTALADLVDRAKGGDALARVTVVVPSKVTGLVLRRELSSRPAGMVGVQFEVWEQVAERLAAPRLARRGSQPLGARVHDLLVAEAARRAPGALGELATHPATLEALGRAVDDLRRATATRDAAPVLAALAAVDDDTPAASAALAGIAAAHRDLVGDRLHDDHDLVLAATEVAAGRLAHELGHVIVALPVGASHAQGVLARTVADHVPVTVLAGRTGDTTADDVTAGTVSRLVGRPITAPAPPPSPPAAPSVRVVVAPDAEEEVRQAVRLVTARLHAGDDLAGISILHCGDDPYPQLLHEVLAAADIPHATAALGVVGQTMAARVLAQLWAWCDEQLPRARLFDLLGSVPARHAGTPIPVAAWDRLARSAHVIGGAHQWDRRLSAAAVQLEDRTADDPDWLRARKQVDAAHVRRLHEFVTGLIDHLEREDATTWAGWAAWALRSMDLVLGRRRDDWTEADRAAEGELRQFLVALHHLDDVRADVPGMPPGVARADFQRMVIDHFERPTGRVGSVGTGVHVGPLRSAGHTPATLSIILGATEGALPPRPGTRPFLTDGVVDIVEGSVGDLDLPRSSTHVDGMRQALHRVLAGSDDTIVMLPRIDRRQQRPARPGPWVLELLRTRMGRPVPVEDVLSAAAHAGDTAAPRLLEGVESSMAGLLAATPPAGVHEFRRRLLAHHVVAGGTIATHPLADTLPGLVHGIRVDAARNAPEFGSWDGHIPEQRDAVARAARRPQSPGTLASYGVCPRRWLFHQVLAIRRQEPPRHWLDISALDRGDLVHTTLERWVGEVIDQGGDPGGGDGDDPQGPQDHDDDQVGTLARLRVLFDDVCNGLEQTGRVNIDILWQQERARIWRRLLAWHEQHRVLQEHGPPPHQVEAPFGMADDDDGLVVATSAGIDFTLRGRIDRLDADDDEVVVVDYKTGRPDRYKGLGDDITLSGTELQLPIYGLVAAQAHPDAHIRVGYWHVHDDAPEAPSLVDFDETARSRTTQVLDTIAAGIEAGVFPADPGDERMWPSPHWSHCAYCPFTTICPSHGTRGRAARRDLASPAVQVLAPLEDPDPDDGEQVQ